MIFALIALVLSGFLSSTLLPGTSEAAFAAFLMYYPEYFILSVVSVTFANSLGSFTTLLIGGFIPNKKKHPDKAEKIIKMYGTPVLFFSFLPIMGDILPLVAGWLRVNKLSAFIFIAAGKFCRYCVIALVTLMAS